MADIRPTPEQRPIVGGLARLLETADKFARKPFGYENPPAAMVSDFLSIPPLYRTLENYAYGSPLASGTSSVSRYLPKLTADTKGAIEGAINVSPLAAPVIRGTRMATTALGKAGERMAERTVPSIMQRGNVGADLLSALALGTTSNVIKPEGGNWIKGAAQKYVNPLRARLYDSSGAADPAMRLQSLYEKYGPEGAEEIVASGMFPHIQEKAALNRFVDKKLARYIQNEMGTPSDSLRLQADAWAETQQKLLADKQKQIDKVRADIDRVRQERDVNPEVLTRSQARLRELQKEQDLIKNRKGIHSVPRGWGEIDTEVAQELRKIVGMPTEGMGLSPVARSWENTSDRAIKQASYADQMKLSENRVRAEAASKSPEEYEAALKQLNRESLESLGGQYAVDNPQSLAYSMTHMPPRDLGFDHLMDELHNALLNEALPEYLRLTPKTLDKMSVAQAAEHVDKINAWRASQKAEVDRARAANAATVVHKEYPEQGLKWVELKEPDVGDVIPEGWSEPVTKGNALQTKSVNGDVVLGESLPELIKNIYKRHPDTPGNPRAALEDALKYEGEILQHCVGGYCPDVVEGRSRIFSLRDADGRPHATIEVQPSDDYDLQKAINWKTYLELQEKDPDAAVKYAAEIKASLPNKIKQIKGAQNRKPEAEFIPYIQDFVKSDDWHSVGDLGHTDLIDLQRDPVLLDYYLRSIFPDSLGSQRRELLDAAINANPNTPRFMTLEQLRDLLKPVKPTGYAEGGKKKLSPFDELVPTFGQRMGAAAADKLTEAGLWLYDKLAKRDGLSSAHKIYLDTFVHDKRDPITAKDFNPQDLVELQNLIQQKEKLTGNKGKGYIQYEDYKTLPGGDQRRGVPANLIGGVLPPRLSLGKSLGQFNYERDPKTGQFRIIDEYDFNPQHIRVDGEKVEVPVEFYGDYVEDAGFSPYALARLYGGRKMPPGTGRKVELSVPSKAKGGLVDYDPDEIAQLAQNIVEGLAPYGLRHSGEGVKGKGYFGELAGRDGVVTEMSAEDESGEYPLVVPTLTAEELDSLIAGEPLSEEIQSKARSWADTRRSRGQSPFASPTELRMPRPSYAEGGSVYSPRPGLVFVGQEHGAPADVPQEVRDLANQVGAFYEGSGGDKLPNIRYRGSWDDAASKSIKGYPPEYLYTIFTNTDVNRQKDALVGEGTIFNNLLKNQQQVGYFKDRRFNRKDLSNFLQSMGPEFLRDSQNPATESNVDDFLKRGEQLMWESGDTPARQLADRANESRQRWLLSQPKGVFFMGSDHLQKLKELHGAGKKTPVKKAEGGLAMQVGGIASMMKLIKKLATDVKKAEKAGDTKDALNKREQLNEAIKSVVNSPDMPRSQPLTKAQIDAYAERMAPQVAGELTREAKGSKTIAGKSQKQFKREQTLPVDRRVMEGEVDPSAPLPIMTLEDQKDSVLLGLPGDPSLARIILYGIGDVEFARPVGLHGGPRYGDENKLWASNLSAATGLLNTADRASRQYGDAPVIASYMKMPSGLPFAQHYFESLLQYQRPDELTKAAKKALTDDIRAGYIDAEGNRIKFPNFPGFDNLDKVAEMAQIDSGLRKHIADRLEKSTKYGLRPAADVQFAVSHPELTNLETGASGFTLGELIPAPLTESAHPTYSHDIAGKVLGQMRYSTPYDLLYRDQLELIRRNPKSPEFNTLKLMGARQKIDEQLINEVNEYQERLRQLIGKYKGGIYDAEDSVGMQVGGGVSALIKMMKRLSAEGKKTEKAADFEELIARLPKAPPEVEARVLAEIEARDRARREMYKVPEVDKTKGKKALAEARRILMTPEERAAYEAQLREQGLQSFLEPSKVKERLYHGTSKDITEFDPNLIGENDFGWYGPGHYLTIDPNTASAYANYEKVIESGKLLDAPAEGANVLPVHVQLRNPYYWPEGRPPARSKEESLAIGEELKSKGYDGVIVPNKYQSPEYAEQHEVVVFDPKHIKSAIGNRGTYDITDPDITKRRGGVIKKAKGGVVDYDPAEIDTLVSQLKEEFHG